MIRCKKTCLQIESNASTLYIGFVQNCFYPLTFKFSKNIISIALQPSYMEIQFLSMYSINKLIVQKILNVNNVQGKLKELNPYNLFKI